MKTESKLENGNGSDASTCYALYSGLVRSKTDRGLHYIGFKELIYLYGLDPSQCFNGNDERNWVGRRGLVIDLGPREDGNYSLPHNVKEQPPALTRGATENDIMSNTENRLENGDGSGASACSDIVETENNVGLITLNHPTEGEGYDDGFKREMELIKAGWSHLVPVMIDGDRFIKILYDKNSIFPNVKELPHRDKREKPQTDNY